MSTPLEIRRVVPPAVWRFVAIASTLGLGGGILLVTTLIAASTGDLTRFQQLNAVMFGVIGVQLMTFGLTRPLRHRGLLSRAVTLRLSDEGISVRHGTFADHVGWGRLAWTDLSAIVVRTRTLGPPLFGAEVERPVVSFVARDEAAIKFDRITSYDATKAVVLGISPAAAMLSMIVATYGPDQVRLIEAWLTQHRPDVLFHAPSDLVH